MATLVRVFLVLFISSIVTVQCTGEDLQRYIPMILGIREKYLTSVICLSLPHKDPHSPEFGLVNAFVREFSRKGVKSVAIRNDELQKFSQSYGKQASRPLLVVLLRAVEDFHDFSENKQKMTKLNPIWLLIFTDEFGAPVCDYCKKPSGNIFHVRFDTEMLISCCNDPTLKEWWSIFPNKTETAVLGNWTAEDGFKLLVSKNLYKRRNSLNGLKLRVCIPLESPYYLETNGKPDGFYIALAKELQHAMNFEMIAVMAQSKSRMSLPIFFDGAREMKCDLYVEPFIITPERMKLVDFTSPVAEAEIVLMVRQPDGSEMHTAYFQVFTRPVWIAIMCLTIGSAILLAILESRQHHSFTHNFFMKYLNIWGMFCDQGIPVFPVRSSLKIIYFSVFITALVVSAIYNSLLISYATVSPRTLSFSTIEEFADDGSYGLILSAANVTLSFFQDDVISKMKSLILPDDRHPKTMSAAIKQVCNEKVGLMALSTGIKTKFHDKVFCNLHVFHSGSRVHMGMMMPLGSQFTGVINYQLQRFRQYGVMNRLKLAYKTAPITISRTGTTPSAVTLNSVAPAFFILAGGMALSLLMLLCERLYARFANSRSLRKQRRQIANSRKFYPRRMLNNYIEHQPWRQQLGLRRYPTYSNNVRSNTA